MAGRAIAAIGQNGGLIGLFGLIAVILGAVWILLIAVHSIDAEELEIRLIGLIRLKVHKKAESDDGKETLKETSKGEDEIDCEDPADDDQGVSSARD